jgi:hypothetical protein
MGHCPDFLAHSSVLMQFPCWIRCCFLFPKFARKFSLREDGVGLAAYACICCIIMETFVEAIIITAIVAAIKIPIALRFIIVTANK